MPIPLLMLGAAGVAAYAALRERSGAGADVGGAIDTIDPTEDPTVSASGLSAATTAWADELDAQRGGIDLDVLLRWVQRESDGNPCSVGSIAQLTRDGWAREAGIGQVYFERRDQRVFGVTSDELRAAAQAGTQQLARELTPGERLQQTSSLIAMCSAYVLDGGGVLQTIGQQWSAEDIYCLAKLKHALPVLSRDFLRAAGAIASDWDAFRAWLEALSIPESTPIYSGSASYYPWTRYLNNAQYTGRGK